MFSTCVFVTDLDHGLSSTGLYNTADKVVFGGSESSCEQTWPNIIFRCVFVTKQKKMNRSFVVAKQISWKILLALSQWSITEMSRWKQWLKMEQLKDLRERLCDVEVFPHSLYWCDQHEENCLIFLPAAYMALQFTLKPVAWSSSAQLTYNISAEWLQNKDIGIVADPNWNKTKNLDLKHCFCPFLEKIYSSTVCF